MFSEEGPTPAKKVRFLFRYVAYWRVKMKKEKIDPGALFARKAEAYRPFAPIGLGLHNFDLDRFIFLQRSIGEPRSRSGETQDKHLKPPVPHRKENWMRNTGLICSGIN
jgi:hypothetical protein